jgi:hypothetical protein
MFQYFLPVAVASQNWKVASSGLQSTSHHNSVLTSSRAKP